MTIAHPKKFTFMMEEENNILNNAFIVEDITTWDELIIKFANFLSADYGYDIKDKIVFVSDYGFNDEWSVIGSRTITSEALKVAKEYDKDMEDAQMEMDFE